ncbi:MAG: molybdate ABC transporter substrate-binding protein [Crocinitomicaceae bacterium]|nr:molybdate ABC transporter substrate-binding protein [Crocinitomicaceae bacterium]
MRQIVYSILAVFVLIGCSNKSKLVVATSANMQFAVEEIQDKFEKEEGIAIDLIIGSSGKLSAQIEQGAPYDVFISANTKYPQYLFDKNLTEDEPKVYAHGRLVLWTCKNFIPSLDSLTSGAIEKIAIANPKHAPYGEAAVSVLKNEGIYDAVLPKLVYAESISQCNHLITTKAVDVGFTSYSTISSEKMKNTGNWIAVDNTDHDPIEQAAVIIKNSDKKEAARKFYEFLFSDPAIDILQNYGYLIPGHE